MAPNYPGTLWLRADNFKERLTPNLSSQKLTYLIIASNWCQISQSVTMVILNLS